jgi:hypothetical protein
VEFFDEPDALDVGKVEVEGAHLYEAVGEQRLGLIEVEAVDDAVGGGIERGANGFGQTGMFGDD